MSGVNGTNVMSRTIGTADTTGAHPVHEFGTALIRTSVYRHRDGFTWVREPGPAFSPPPSELSPRLSALLGGLHPAVRAPERDAPGGALRYRTGGMLPAAGWLAFDERQAGPPLRDALRSAGAALAALHALPAPAEVTATGHPGIARLSHWLAGRQDGAVPARLRRHALARLGRTRWRRIGALCAEFAAAGGDDLLHGAASMALIVPGRRPDTPGAAGALLTGESLCRGPWWLDLGWLLAELVELEQTVETGLAPELRFDYAALRAAVLEGHGRSPEAGVVGALSVLRVLTHARDYATYVGWDDQLHTYLDLTARLCDQELGGTAALPDRSASPTSQKNARSLMYPPAPRHDLVEDVHGVPVADPYRRLEDPDDPATRRWSAAQQELFREHAQDLPGRAHFRRRLAELQRIGFVGPPSWHGDRYFFMRRTPEQEHMVLHVAEPDGTERVLLDPLAIDPTGRTVVDSWQPSADGRLLAYQLSTGGREESVLWVLDTVTGEVVDGPIDRCRYSTVAWLPDGKSFYYVRRLPADAVPPGEEQYHRRVYLHRVGTSPEEDVLIFGEGRDKTTKYRVSISGEGRWLTVSASLGTASRNDLWLADLAASPAEAPEFRVVQEGVDAHTALRVGRDGRAYLMTDRDAPRGRIVVTDPADPRYETWRDLIPEDPEAVLSDFAILDGLPEPVLVLSRTRHAVTELTRHDLRTGELLGPVPTPGLGTASGLSVRPEGGHELWFAYTDTTTPVSVQRYDARTGETSLWAAAPGGAEPPRVESRWVDVRSKDGTPVRMMVLSAPGATGPRPCLITGYGGFGVSMVPAFNPLALAWVEAGGVYAVPQLRGGGEKGEEWHRAGMLGNKQNVFDDFHAAAERLIADGWTTPDRLAATGGSNGGLLVGAALTQRPELFAAVVCSSPLLDMVRYERSGLGAAWRAEYGSASDPEQFRWLYGYSPYHKVRQGVDYPAVLFTVAEADTRVDPYHARKMCAALQWATAERAAQGLAAPILLRSESDVGHGARAVSGAIELNADVLAFCAAHTGLAVGED